MSEDTSTFRKIEVEVRDGDISHRMFYRKEKKDNEYIEKFGDSLRDGKVIKKSIRGVSEKKGRWDIYEKSDGAEEKKYTSDYDLHGPKTVFRDVKFIEVESGKNKIGGGGISKEKRGMIMNCVIAISVFTVIVIVILFVIIPHLPEPFLQDSHSPEETSIHHQRKSGYSVLSL